MKSKFNENILISAYFAAYTAGMASLNIVRSTEHEKWRHFLPNLVKCKTKTCFVVGRPQSVIDKFLSNKTSSNPNT